MAMSANQGKEPPLSVLIALSALAILPINLFVPSLPNIASEFGASFALVNVAVAGYALVTAFTHLIAGALSDRFGRKPVALFALLGFTLASIGCSVASNIHAFLICRLLQSVVIAGYAVSLAAIRDTSADRNAAASRIGYVASAWAVAPMIGPTFGGLLDAYFGWRASFHAFTLLGVAGLYLAVFHLPETNHQRSTSILLQLKGYGQLMRSQRFLAYALCMMCAIGTLYVFIGGAPLMAHRLGETSTTVIGLYMGIVPAGFITGSYVVGRLGSRHPAASFILAGRLLTCSGLLIACVLLLAGVRHPLAFFAPCVTIGLGNGLTMSVANASVLSLQPGLAGTASGLAAALTVIGAGSIAFVSGLVVTPDNATVAVPAAMLTASLLSIAAALAIRRSERLAATASESR